MLTFYKKQHKKFIKVTKKKKAKNLFLKYTIGLQNLKLNFITTNQIECLRKLIIRKLKRVVTIIIRCFCLIPLTKKAIGTRMGKGIGLLNTHLFFIKSGTIFIELFNLKFRQIKKVFRQLKKKYKLTFFLLKRSFFFKQLKNN